MRAEKGSPNENAYRTLIPGVVLAIIILLGVDPAARIYDRHLKPRPWISATITLVPTVGAKPNVRYAVHSRSYVSGRWRAWVETESGVRVCGGTGTGSYSARHETPRMWGWNAWLGADCAEPPVPYRLCVSYDVSTPSGVPGDFGPSCSAIHDPRSEP